MGEPRRTFWQHRPGWVKLRERGGVEPVRPQPEAAGDHPPACLCMYPPPCRRRRTCAAIT